MRSAALLFDGGKYDAVRCADYKGLSYDRGQAFLVRLRLRGSARPRPVSSARDLAPAAGFEPATKWLTATYSTAELCRTISIKPLEG